MNVNATNVEWIHVPDGKAHIERTTLAEFESIPVIINMDNSTMLNSLGSKYLVYYNDNTVESILLEDGETAIFLLKNK